MIKVILVPNLIIRVAMRILIVFFILLLVTMGARAQSKVVAQITNFENTRGTCRACLFTSAASFSGEGGEPFKCVQAPVTGKTVQAVFEDIPPGTYALFVLHDANNNKKMDKNFLGIPKEGYGASKNKLPFAAAPGFNENRFAVEHNTTVRLTVKLRYL
jgi:uncharacterized protein (DUF2141 family)